MTQINTQSALLEQPIAAEESVSIARTGRFEALDLQRGMIMTLMALAHSREYSSDPYTNSSWQVTSAWKGHNWLDALQQVIVGSGVAGGFFMMMGVGIFFLWHSWLKDGRTPKEIFNYLFLRGSLLVLLQLTILEGFELVSSDKPFFLYAGVFMTLGLCMMGAACCMRLIAYLKHKIPDMPWEYIVPLVVIVTITLTMQILVGNLQAEKLQPTFNQVIFLITGNTYYNGILLEINYTPIPWFPAVAMGLIVGKILQPRNAGSMRQLKNLAFGLVAAWFILRTATLTGWLHAGDYKQLADSQDISWISWFCASKHPPSIEYFLWACGMNLSGIVLWYKVSQSWPAVFDKFRFLKILAQCALFFFVVHWFVYFGLSLLLPEKLTTPMPQIGFWLVGMIVLFYLCRRFHAFKFRQSKYSWWRMF
ncbi:hypothetical protein ACFORL_03210 [Legionella dresdenensis]|uniref:Heparan-alpha-glucosaminide N-acetyltransferase catalytic domain-containing protein n=1 Tax=Legionella dresdenensis TaxID=450200 RepID=A0ABV8CDP4_9GAMM